MSDPDARLFVIWSHEHRAWWRPARRGYTPVLAEAGRYSFDEAAAITVGHGPAGEEVAMLESEALRRGPPLVEARR